MERLVLLDEAALKGVGRNWVIDNQFSSLFW
jgi:hypothetical protein